MALLPRDNNKNNIPPISPYSAASELSYDDYSSTPSGHHPGTINTLDQSQSYSLNMNTTKTTTTTRPQSRDRSADMYSYLKTLLNGSGAEKDLDQAVKSLMGEKTDDETSRRTNDESKGSEPERTDSKLPKGEDEDGRTRRRAGFETSAKPERRDLPALPSKEGTTTELQTADPFATPSRPPSSRSMNEDTVKPRNIPKGYPDDAGSTKSHREEESESVIADESGSFVRPKSLMDLSNLLVTSGFPPLSSAVVAEEASTADGHPNLTGPQIANLVTAMARVISEYRRRGRLIQQMTEKIAEVEKRIQKQNERRAERAEEKENARKVEFQKVLKAAEEQTEAVRQSLSASEAETAKLGDRCAQLEDLLKKQREEAETARREHGLLVRKTQQNQQRNEQTFQGIMREFTKHRRDPSKAPIDRLTLEVIDVYERKLDDLNQKLDDARKRTSTIPGANRSSTAAHGTSTVTADGQTRDDQTRTIQLVDDVNEASDFSVSQKPLQEKITYLKARLNDTTERLKETEKKNEVMKLQLLSQKKPIAGLTKVKRTDKSHFGTLDMIKRDKLTYKLRLWRVDEFGLEECRACIKDILVKLRLDEVTSLLPVIDDIVRVVRLVPQMEHFITSIDDLVWGPYGVNADGGSSETSTGVRPPPHKLTETERMLHRWRNRMNEMDALLVFRRAVHHALRIAESKNSRSERACLDELRRLMNADRQQWASSTQAEERRHSSHVGGMDRGEDDYVLLSKYVKHFRDLFEVDSMDGVLPKISQLYQYVCEVDTGLRRLRDVLKFDGKCSPGKTLSSAARILEELMLAEDEPPEEPKHEEPSTANRSVVEEFEREPSYEGSETAPPDDDDRMYDPGSPRETRNVIYGIEHDEQLRMDRSEERKNGPSPNDRRAIRSTEHMNVDDDDEEDRRFSDEESQTSSEHRGDKDKAYRDGLDRFRRGNEDRDSERRSTEGFAREQGRTGADAVGRVDDDDEYRDRVMDDSTSQVLRSLTALRSRLG